MKTNTKAAYVTLIEIMIVIAIIGLVVALFVPSIQKAKKDALKKQGRAEFKVTQDDPEMYQIQFSGEHTNYYECFRYEILDRDVTMYDQKGRVIYKLVIDPGTTRWTIKTIW